ncbi:MAG TPA: hypothetical protein VJ809_05855 [Pirellulales bacterium]|nr:hypothetical protein [Pirellulales bacterium]
MALGIYGPRPYESDGGFSAQGLLLTTVVGVAVAVATGVLAAIVGRFFYAVLIFPLFIGAAVGAAQAWAVRHTKIRTPIACGAAGLIAGIVAVVTIHYVEYTDFQGAISEAALDEQALREALASTPDAEEQEYLKEALALSQAFSAEAREVNSFTSYLDWSARQGVEISASRGSSTPLNLGYTGSYIYWGVEALIVALISAAMARSRASEPFCVACDAWKTQRELGVVPAKAKTVGEIVDAGRLADLPALPAAAGEETAISVYECPCCNNAEDLVLQVDSITYNQGSRVKSQTARAVYPRKALEELERYFVSSEDMPLCRDIDPDVIQKLKAAADRRETGELVAAKS